MDTIEPGTSLNCYRNYDCDYMEDSYNPLTRKYGDYRFKPGYVYTIGGCGSLFMMHGVVNHFTGEEYKPHKMEAGFNMEITKWKEDWKENESEWIYFSTDPKSPIFYGKWFFDDEKLREYKLSELLD